MPSARTGTPRRVVVVTPTYDEAANIETTLRALRAAVPAAHVLVVDDASPDGTGRIAETFAARDDHVHVLHRDAKDGLGRAYLAGFAWARERGYDIVVEFDADGSHPADALPAMLAALDEPGVGLVIGSRWVPGGALVDWPAGRRRLSKAANAYARVMLRLPVRDTTAGFRAYRSSVLDAIAHEVVDSRGYCFQIDLTIRTHDAGWSIREVPITFTERRAGSSKMTRAVVAEAMVKVTAWGIARRLRPPQRRASGQGTTPTVVESPQPSAGEGAG